MADKFRGHHIVCTSLYEGKGYSGAFCENMTAVVERLRKDPDEELLLVAEPDMICANCPNRTETNECVHNHNRVVNKDRRVIEFFGLEENRVYTYREMCRHARAAMNWISLWRTVENATGASRGSASTKICSHSSTVVSRKNRR